MKMPFFFLAAVLMISCTKERTQTPDQGVPVEGGRIVVNEVMATLSEMENEFGETADWFELYNAGNALTLKAGQWFVTDDVDGNPRKFELPEATITAEGFLVIWCDGRDQKSSAIHTNFKLSPNDGSLAVVYAKDNEELAVSEAPISASPAADISFGRAPDGTAFWTTLSLPTPGAPNEALAPPGN